MDMTNLTPAPWYANNGYRVHGPTDSADKRDGAVLFDGKHCEGMGSDLEFAALARNAFDIMMRWKLQPEAWLVEEGQPWGVDSALRRLPEELTDMRWPDPFTALVEADAWLKAQEARPSTVPQ